MAGKTGRLFLSSLVTILGVAGIVIASLALRERYNTGVSPCSINDVWDCGIVNHSPYAAIGGVPVAAIGIVGYALLPILVWRFPRITAAGAFLGLIFSLRLTWIEWKDLGVWCLYCVSSQIIIAIIFVLTLVRAWMGRQNHTS